MKILENGKVEFTRDEWRTYMELPPSERLMMHVETGSIATESQWGSDIKNSTQDAIEDREAENEEFEDGEGSDFD